MTPIAHPSVHRPTDAALLISLVAAPAAWILQLAVSYGLASYACQPIAAPVLRPPGFEWSAEQWLLLAVNLACLIVTLAAGVAPWRARQAEIAASGGGEGKASGHVGFLAVSGLLSSGGFAIGVAFNTVAVFTIPACWSVSG
jgi:hypothetical protein